MSFLDTHGISLFGWFCMLVALANVLFFLYADDGSGKGALDPCFDDMVPTSTGECVHRGDSSIWEIRL